MELLFKELTYQIKGFTYDVQNEIRVGFDEETYHEALKLRLDRAGIPYVSKATKYLEHRGIQIHKFQLDLLVADKVVLELKPTSCAKPKKVILFPFSDLASSMNSIMR